MPGRDELLQQNIARAQSKAASPQPQESVGKAPTTAIGAGGPRSFFGGNYEVYSALESIQFQGALGDASMRGNIAYIRVWKRGGTAAQTNSSAATQDPGNGDALTVLGDAVEQEYGPEREGLPDDAVVIYDTDTLSYSVESGDLTRDEDGNITNGFVQSSFLPTPNPQRQQALGAQTPTTSGVQSSSTQIVAPVAPSTTGTALSTGLQQGVGQVRSANPNGFTNALLNFGRSFIGGGGGGGSGQANAPKVKEGAVPASGDMMWQFLFNPSELQLEAGPEFKGAEVWGVSDKANSGQPLHWSHNKNASLKFNSVLLNGFVFGRKVEALEQGLLELFMSREGEGQYGPHVLEFVWGKRSFGPCVIKNIDVKEKMWDEGEVVNAELSFTLEQIPEWTINDGAYVDVARPGRQPLANDPIESNNADNPSGTAAPSTESPNPGPAQSPAQKPSSSVNIAGQCKSIISDREYLQRIINEVQSKLEGVGGLEYGPLGILKSDTRSVFKQNLGQYKRTFQKYSGNSFYKPSMREGILGVKCINTSSIEYSWNNSGNALVRIKDRNANSALLTCYKNILSVVNKQFNSNKCSNFAAPSGGRQGPGLF